MRKTPLTGDDIIYSPALTGDDITADPFTFTVCYTVQQQNNSTNKCTDTKTTRNTSEESLPDYQRYHSQLLYNTHAHTICDTVECVR